MAASDAILDRKTIPIVPAQTSEPHAFGICAEAEPYALRVIGDSMAPEFTDGHIVIVDPVMTAHPGAYVIVDYAGETTLRQMVHDAERKYLRALNPSYPTIELTGEYRVRGVVVQRAGRRRGDRRQYYAD